MAVVTRVGRFRRCDTFVIHPRAKQRPHPGRGVGPLFRAVRLSGGFSCLDCRLGMGPTARHYWGVVIDGSLAEKFAMRNLHPATLPDEPEVARSQFVVN